MLSTAHVVHARFSTALGMQEETNSVGAHLKRVGQLDLKFLELIQLSSSLDALQWPPRINLASQCEGQRRCRRRSIHTPLAHQH